MKNILLVLFLLGQIVVFGQSSTNDLFKLANEKVNAGDFEQARILFGKVAPVYFKSENWTNYLESKNKICRINLVYAENLDAIEKEINSLIELANEKLGSNSNGRTNAMRNLAIYHMFYSGDYERSGILLDKIIEILKVKESYDSIAMAETFQYAAQSYFYAGKFEIAKTNAKEAINLFEDFNDRDVGLAYNLLGNVHWATGEYDSSMYAYNKSLFYNKIYYGDTSSHVAWSYNNIAYVHRAKNQLALAGSYFERARIIREIIFKHDNVDLVESYSNLAMVYVELKDHDKAIEYGVKTVNMMTDIYGSYNPKLAMAYSNLVSPLIAKNKISQAKEYTLKALAINKNNSGQSFAYLSDVYTKLSFIYAEQNKIDSSNFALSKAISYLKDGEKLPGAEIKVYTTAGKFFMEKGQFKKAHEFFNKVISRLKFDELNYESFHLLQSIVGELHILNQYHKEVSLDSVNKLIRSGQHLIDEISRSLSKQEDRFRLAGLIHEFYSEVVDVYYLLYKQDDKLDYLISIYRFIELSKSNELRFNLNEKFSQFKAGIPDSIIRLEKDISNKISDLYSNSGDSTLQYYRLRDQQDSLIAFIEKAYPKYHQLKYAYQPPSISNIQSKLGDKDILLDFLVTDKSIFRLELTRESVNIFKTKIHVDTLRNVVNELNRQINIYNDISKAYWEKYVWLSSNIKQVLFDSLSKTDNNRLIIIPDDLIYEVPFGVLASGTYSEIKFLIEQNEIFYAYSADNFMGNYTDDNPNLSQKKRLIAYAPNDFDSTSIDITSKRDKVANLIWNSREIDALQRLFDGTFRRGREASETAFKNEAPSGTIIHLASHALVDSENPLLSRLVFTKYDSLNDGALYVHEISNLELNSHLIVLSACSTGKGKAAEGLGTLSLAHSFASAGVPGIIMTKWAIDDRSTSQIMRYFYENLSKGMSKSEALRSSQLKFLESASPEKKHPYYWGAFMFVGVDGKFANSSGQMIFVFFTLLTFFSVIYFVEIRRS